ncbi:MAG: ATP synthase F0 subunit B [Deltaproteobacteria bacterium]|nr:ATP synthase F0 subunit B [Deltaproteobacteria bacterium]
MTAGKPSSTKETFFTLLFLFLLLPINSFASNQEHASPDWLTLGLSAINFVLFILLLVFLLKKPAKDFFSQRHKEISSRIEEARKIKQEAESKYKEYEQRLKHLDEEVEQILKDARSDGEREKQKIIEEAERTAEKIKRDAGRMVEQELRSAKLSLKKEAVSEAVEAAAKILKENLSRDDDLILVKTTVEQLGKRGGNA